jgi:hypothetical protein
MTAAKPPSVSEAIARTISSLLLKYRYTAPGLRRASSKIACIGVW